MRQLSPIRILRVFRHGPSLLDLSPNKFLPPASSTTLFTTFFRHCQLCDPHGQLLSSAPPPPHYNSIRPACRPNRHRLPSRRCIESARTHRAPACAVPLRASDTTLRLPRHREGRGTIF